MTEHLSTRTRWLALVILCVGDLMIVVDTTVVNVALPSIRRDLGFTQTSLAWVVNAYMLTFGGFLLLAGRFGDLFGHRRLFLVGTGAFTLASLVCGLSTSQEMLIAARAVQGLGGALVSALAFSLIVVLFTEPAERAKAMGVFGFVMAGGGSIGVLAGGVLTDLVGWHWIFLVNLPIGIAVTVAGMRLLPSVDIRGQAQRLDVGGAVAITGGMVLAVYAIVNGNTAGWTSAQTLGLLAAAVVILAGFVAWERRASAPLMPLGIFRHRNLSVANVVGVFWAAAMFALFFLSALYLQLVLGYSPLQVGLAFLPGNLIMMAFSLGLSAKLVTRYGFRAPLAFGLGVATLALLWLARAPVHGTFVVDVLPTMILFGIGGGLAFNPVLMAAMSDVEPQESGLASGIVNTAFMMGGALGLAVLASAASARTQHLAATGHGPLAALTGGYHLAFVLGAIFSIIAGVVGATFLRNRTVPAGAVRGEPALEPA
ncbi:MAG TPA: DHA2 family efflux MFS transporter permease subunit [Solirubrobacteraceae bacterium]|nr:DHA2 family efflux MFS transporter permease subunit [Solirubrobacteraceae bacterium]